MMMRKSPPNSMQKTYDECYLICSTAIYFEGQNNEAEALRAWRNALDQIYYHNAYKMPSNYVPRSETEKALQDSLRAMELQCKERVDLLEALRQSRIEAEDESKSSGGEGHADRRSSPAGMAGAKTSTSNGGGTTWLGGDTIPPATYEEIPRPLLHPHVKRPSPSPSPRPPSYSRNQTIEDSKRPTTVPAAAPHALAPPPPNESARARTPSPEKKPGGMLRTLRSNPKEKPAGKMSSTLRSRPPSAAARAATQVWAGPRPHSDSQAPPSSGSQPSVMWDPYTRKLVDQRQVSGSSIAPSPSPSDPFHHRDSLSSLEESGKSRKAPPPYPDEPITTFPSYLQRPLDPPAPPTPPPHAQNVSLRPAFEKPGPSISQLGTSSISYMKEYPNHPPMKKRPPPVPPKGSGRVSDSDGPSRSNAIGKSSATSSPVPRKAVARATGVVNAMTERQKLDNSQPVPLRRTQGAPQRKQQGSLSSSPEYTSNAAAKRRPPQGTKADPTYVDTTSTNDDSPDSENPTTPSEREEWEQRVKYIMKNLPKGVDETAAKQILNEIVIHGDEVHWDDVAGLEIAKSALKETVVYPFLRPDLFMGLREPARGMLLFGPPGTGKTMLARAVATESKSVFFAISASSLTSKFLGESEKLVRALFALAKALAPSIIFVDEIDSLLGARGGGSEHEATRRIKTEFLIGWSDLQKAAAGREDKDSKGDATRVLVLAATNLPWAIDEAARRRFVRRQYIPLPEDWVREKQLRTLLSAQKHSLTDADLRTLVRLTDGYSGSDITALAKDAAMGPLRSLGERLLHMSPDEIRPIGMEDFKASLVNIRPSVSKQGLQEFEDWAKEFGERGG